MMFSFEKPVIYQKAIAAAEVFAIVQNLSPPTHTDQKQPALV